ncbi:MAG: hypothetical protein ABIL09_13875 [Gemmatimonadota bacterium]
MLHVVGDSHARAFAGVVAPEAVHWIGPVLMYSVARDGVPGLRASREWLDRRGTLSGRQWLDQVGPGDVILFVFGEIDVRCHLAEQADRIVAGTEDERDAIVVDRLVQLFTRTLRSIRSAVGCEVAVCHPVPAMQSHDPGYPCAGTLERRRAIRGRLCAALDRMGGLDTIPVVSPAVEGDDGGIEPVLRDFDVIHLSAERAAPVLRAALAAAGLSP